MRVYAVAVQRDIERAKLVGGVRARDGERDARAGDLDEVAFAWLVVSDPDVEHERRGIDGDVERAADSDALDAARDGDGVDVVAAGRVRRRRRKCGDGEHRGGGEPAEPSKSAAAAARESLKSIHGFWVPE